MQKYVAYKVETASFFGNFSGTGAGKTLSAILASRIINSRMTLIVCPDRLIASNGGHERRKSYLLTKKGRTLLEVLDCDYHD